MMDSSLQNLVWKDVIGFEGLYKVSYCGKVYSSRRFGSKGGLLLPTSFNGDYPRVTLTKKNKHNTLKVHRLVAFAHIDNPLCLPYVNHKDGDKLNFHGDNLEWTTQQNNVRHAWRTGLSKALKGEMNGSSKITDDQRIGIVRDYALTNLTQDEISRKYGVTQSNVSLIVRAFLKEHFSALDGTKL